MDCFEDRADALSRKKRLEVTICVYMLSAFPTYCILRKKKLYILGLIMWDKCRFCCRVHEIVGFQNGDGVLLYGPSEFPVRTKRRAIKKGDQ